MTDTNRRAFIGGLAVAAGTLATTSALADGADGHAAGYDVAPSEGHVPLIPRRTGEPVTFTTSLDKGAIKATSGGWARDITTKGLPIATDIAGAHLYLNAGGVREMHWHNSAEWAYILAGHCQVTVVDPDGEAEVANYEPGDLWYFPKGHAHAIQALGSEPCHAILAFDDGLYGEHGTFGLSDWMSRLEPGLLSQALGLPNEVTSRIPTAEVYIKQGAVIARNSENARTIQVLAPESTHRFRLMAQNPRVVSPGGTIHVASAREYQISKTFTAVVTKLRPGFVHAPHWHPNANEWHYVAKGRTRVTLFAPDKRMAVAELSAGDCAYIPRGCGHTVQNIGSDECEIVGALDNGVYSEALLSDWITKVPRQLLANNLGLPERLCQSDRRPLFNSEGRVKYLGNGDAADASRNEITSCGLRPSLAWQALIAIDRPSYGYAIDIAPSLEGGHFSYWPEAACERKADPICYAPEVRRQLVPLSRGVIHLYAKILDGALDLGVPQKELHGSQVAGLAIDQGRLSMAKRMRPEQVRIQSDVRDTV